MYTNFDEYKGQLTLFSDSVNQQQPVRRCIDCAARITSILHVDEQHSTIDIHYNFERSKNSILLIFFYHIFYINIHSYIFYRNINKK